MRNQQGFTLIELIIVIVILGILAVTAAPQFMNFSSEARTGTVKGLEGSVKAASEMVHAKALLGKDAANNTVSIGGGKAVSLTAGSNYAMATSEGIVQALNIDVSEETGDWFVTKVANDVTGGALAQDLVIHPRGVSLSSTKPQCYVYYREVSDTVTAPVIGSATEDCE